MKASTRRKISYVVKSDNEEQAHCLGVNSLAIDTNHYQTTGDVAEGGILYSAGRDGIIASWDLNLKFRKENVDNGEKWSIDNTIESLPKTSCKAFSQMHTDWVNDIVLCNGGSHVVSASSDRTIKLWKPYSDTPTVAHTIGWHTDYAKCLTYASRAGWVASGGLDRRINIWDLEKSEAVISIDAGPTSHLVDGSTENNSVLHNSASKCSIYALAVNPAGTLLASGSPEKVVRLWDPRAGKRISKFTGHTDNIRALLISDDGHYILSGSSDSTIKLWSVKAQRCLTTYETHPDSVWSLYSNHPELKTFYSGSRDGLVNKTEITGQAVSEGDSECVGLFKESSGVTKIVALEDAYVWTATSSSSINRWKSIPSYESRQVLPRSEFNPDIPSTALVKLPPAKPSYTSQITDSYIASDQITMYAGSVLSIPMSYQEEDGDSEDTLVPIRTLPDHIIQGKPGIISHRILHNRRHILTKNTKDEIKMWDIIKCVEVKNFGKRNIEEVAQEMNGLESFPAWCSIDTKIGAITVQLHESNCFDCEMYADEVDLPSDYVTREDQRLNLGKWVLVSLFEDFIKKETENEKEGKIRFGQEPVEKADSVKSRTIQTPHEERTEPIEPEPKVRLEPGPFTAPVLSTTNAQTDYFSSTHHSPKESSPTNFMYRLKSLSAKAKLSRTPESAPSEPTPPTETPKPTVDEKPEEKIESYSPPNFEDYPPLYIPRSTMIIIAEESAETSTGIDVYRGTVESVSENTSVIIDVAPTWLLTFLLYNKTPQKETVKLTFVLKPAPDSNLDELPGGPNNRLLANRVLRVRKLIQYIAEKLNVEDESNLELLCGETILTPTMTLATIRHHILKTSGDIPLSYRLKETASQ